MFIDRKDAGRQLAEKLVRFEKDRPLVFAIPRGGVEVGFEVARKLSAELSLIVSRKLPFPDNPEAGFGAIAENGDLYLIPGVRASLPEVTIKRIMEEQEQEIKRRISKLRNGKPLPEIRDRTVILVDDGIAMGSTMRASLSLCRNRQASQVIVAVPVTSKESERVFREISDDFIALEIPSHFYAVAQVYDNWYDVPDEEVIGIMKQAESLSGND